MQLIAGIAAWVLLCGVIVLLTLKGGVKYIFRDPPPPPEDDQ